jgi:hypothetical protein
LSLDFKRNVALFTGMAGLFLSKYIPQPYNSFIYIFIGLGIVTWAIFFSRIVRMPYRIIYSIIVLLILFLGIDELGLYFNRNFNDNIDFNLIFVITSGIVLVIIIPLIILIFGDEERKKTNRNYIIILWIIELCMTGIMLMH